MGAGRHAWATANPNGGPRPSERGGETRLRRDRGWSEPSFRPPGTISVRVRADHTRGGADEGAAASGESPAGARCSRARWSTEPGAAPRPSTAERPSRGEAEMRPSMITWWLRSRRSSTRAWRRRFSTTAPRDGLEGDKIRDPEMTAAVPARGAVKLSRRTTSRSNIVRPWQRLRGTSASVPDQTPEPARAAALMIAGAREHPAHKPTERRDADGESPALARRR